MYIILEGGDASDNLSNFLNLKFKLEEKSNIQGYTSIQPIMTILAHFKILFATDLICVDRK